MPIKDPLEVEPPGPHPGPPPDLASRSPLIQQAVGPWLRFHHSRHEPLHFSRGPQSRFNDPEEQFGVLYLAEEFEGAFIETFGRTLDVRSLTASRAHSTGVALVEPTRPLTLIDLATSGGAARLSADGRLMSGSLPVAQRWARALWEHPAGADGVRYPLRHDPARVGCALFDRSRDALHVASLGTLADSTHRDALVRALDVYQFGLIQD